MHETQHSSVDEKTINRNPSCADTMTVAECELAAFIGEMIELFGPEGATLAAKDRLNELKLMDSLPGSTTDNWQLVSVAASAQLASRPTPAQRRPTPMVASIGGKSRTKASSDSSPTTSPGVTPQSQPSKPGHRGVVRRPAQRPLESLFSRLP